MPNCPDDTELAGFLNDALGSERLGQVGAHVDGCPRCQARLDRLIDHTSGGVARFKQLPSAAGPDARSGSEADTQVLGAKPPSQPQPAPVGLPRVRGFEVLAEIGRGGMGVVYRARHLRLNRLVALKMILAGTAADTRSVQRFLFEAEFLAKVQHPQVVQVYEIDTFQGPNGVPVPYLAMELLEGGSLHRRLKQSAATEPGGAPRWPTPRGAAELVEGLARAVHAAHLRGVIHRDLKPGNILFPLGNRQPAEGSKDRDKAHPSSPPVAPPKVMDFGLAKFTQDAGADLTQSGQIVGTPHYMAPEQASGGRQATPAVDVYALGAILFECLAGRPPFVGQEPISVLMKVVNELPPDVRAVRPDVPRNLAAVTMKCLEKDPARRYDSAEALAKDLRRFLDDRPTRARRVRSAERAWLWAKRNPNVAGLIAALVAVLLIAFVTVAVLWLRAESTAKDERSAKTQTQLARERAEKEGAKATAALRDAQRQKALLEFRRAVASCEEGRVEEGLAGFALVARLAEGGDGDLARVARINLAAWPRELPPRPRALPHRFQPRLAAFHPDGEHLVTVSRGSGAFLWDIATGSVVREYKTRANLLQNFGAPALGTFWTVAVSPDGQTVAAAGTDDRVTFWNLRESDPVATFDVPDGAWSIAFASDRELWCNDGRSGLLKLDLSDRRKPRVAARATAKPGRGEERLLQILTLSPDGKRVYSGDRSGRVREWDAATATESHTWQFSGWITDVAVSPDGARVAATGPEGFVWVVDVATRQLVHELSLAGAYGNGVAFAGKSPMLVASDGDGNVRFWHRDTGQPIGIPMRFAGEVTRPRFRSSTDDLAVPAGDAMYLSGVPDPPGDVVSTGHTRVRGLDFWGERIAVADNDSFTVLAPFTRDRVPLGPVKLAAGPLTVRCDPARPIVYLGTRDGFDQLPLDGAAKPLQVELSRAMERVFALDFAGDRLYARGTRVVARFDPVTLKRVAEKKPVPDIPPGVELGTMAARRDGGEVLVSVNNRAVFLKGDTLEYLREWRAGDELLSAAYTPDGTKVLVGRRDNVAELLDAATGAPTPARPMPHARAVPAVAISHDGALLLTGSRDGTARFWDAVTGLPLGAPLRHAGAVTHVAFSPKRDHAVTGTGTGHVVLWDLPPPPAPGTSEQLNERFGPR